jgi:hypothetical protein
MEHVAEGGMVRKTVLEFFFAFHPKRIQAFQRDLWLDCSFQQIDFYNSDQTPSLLYPFQTP